MAGRLDGAIGACYSVVGYEDATNRTVNDENQ